MLNHQPEQNLQWGNLCFSADTGGAGGGSAAGREVTIANFNQTPADIGEPNLLRLKKIEPSRFREITEEEEAAGGYTDKYKKTGHRGSHLVSQRPVRDESGAIVDWEDRSPILIEEKEAKYGPHPTEEGCFVVQDDKFTTVLVLRSGESIKFSNANEEYAGALMHGDGNALAFDSKGVPYSFPITSNVEEKKAFAVAGTISREEFALELEGNC